MLTGDFAAVAVLITTSFSAKLAGVFEGSFGLGHGFSLILMIASNHFEAGHFVVINRHSFSS
jgi:hypothetical protein